MIVNDIRREAAEAVVAEVVAAGGKAVANSDDITSMAGAEAIVAAGVNAFGDVHGVVNNAGIVRDRMFASLTEDDWDLVVKVHLKGHFCITQTLVKRWRDQVKAGVKVMRASSTPAPARACRARSGRATTPPPRAASRR